MQFQSNQGPQQPILRVYSTNMPHRTKHYGHQHSRFRTCSTNSSHTVCIGTFLLQIFVNQILLYLHLRQYYRYQQVQQSPMSEGKKEFKKIKSKQIAKEDKNGNERNANKNGKVKDQRFKAAEYDPRFIAPTSNIDKIKIDNRFADKMQSQKFQMTGSVDKYGRKQKNVDKMGGMGDYYYSQQPQHKNEPTIKQKQHKKIRPIEEQQQSESQNEENNISKWMKQYNEQSSDQMQDEDIDEMLEQSDGVWSDDEENVIKNDKVQATKRLALCNYDWMNINAKDLMLLFSSFKPTAGTILSVSVYYSQIGKEKMQIEERIGPQGIWSTNIQQQQSKRQQKTFKQQSKSKKLQEEAFNHKKLRAYEKERLKYCFAIIQCNCKKTSDQIYRQCDGNQFENSNILFDLRFVPDDIKFDPQMLKQKCDQIPVSGEVKNFVSRAMGHSNVSLTWQDPQLNGVANLKKKNWGKISDKEMDNIDWSLYINQEVEQTNDNFNKLMNKNKPQPQQKVNVSDWRKECNKKYKRDQEQDDDLQITFPSGFDSKTPKKEQKLSLNKQIKTRKQRWRLIQEQKKKNQQLELLVQKSDKPEFKYNPNDDRFKAVLENPSYHIDPSNPKFDYRKVGAVFEEVVKVNKKKNLL